MEFTNPEAKKFLFELYTMTGGDTAAQVSMYDVGEVVGLEKAEAGEMAEELIVEGMVELVTLSGGISITSEGLKTLDVGSGPSAQGEIFTLGNDRVLANTSRQAVEEIVAEIRSGIGGSQASYSQLEEIVIDIKTIDIQMLSPNPKTEVLREVLRSLAHSVSAIGRTDTAANIHTMISS